MLPPGSHHKPVGTSVEGLLRLKASDFEELVAQIYRQRGYKVQVTPVSRDAGIDLIAFRDDPMNPEKVAVQCRNHRNPVGRPDAQKLLGATSDPQYSEAILIATAGFSRDCLEFAKRHGRLKLVDGTYLCALISDLAIELPRR